MWSVIPYVIYARCLYCVTWNKVPLLWVMIGSYFGFGIPNNRTCMQGQKHFHFLIICIYFYLICSTTPKRFTQWFIFPNPSSSWRYSALIGRFHLKQSAVLLCVQRYRGNGSKRTPSGKEWISIFIQTNEKRATSGRGICGLKTTRFNDSESTLSFERR